MLTHPVLSRLAHVGIKLGLDRIRDFLAFLGNPQDAAPVVHIAGTNGKGSVVTAVTATMVDAGLRVGTTISPHLQAMNERVQVQGVPVDDATLEMGIRAVDNARAAWAVANGYGDDALTYYEFMVCVAFYLFRELKVDVQVVEVGLGGRLDATNVVKPAVTAITSIALDHQAQLGNDLASIAGEKAGIFKAGAPAVVGPLAPEAMQRAQEVAARVGAPFLTPDQVCWEGDVVHTPRGDVGPVTLSMLGAHQRANMAVAVGLLMELRAQLGFAKDAIVSGVSRAKIPGRVERIAADVLIDGAHNRAGAAALAACLADDPRPRVLLWGMGDGRDVRQVVEPILPHVERVITTQCAHPKALTPEEVAERLGELPVPVEIGGPIEEALAAARDGRVDVVAAGSLFVAGAVRDIVGAQ